MDLMYREMTSSQPIANFIPKYDMKESKVKGEISWGMKIEKDGSLQGAIKTRRNAPTKKLHKNKEKDVDSWPVNVREVKRKAKEMTYIDDIG